MKRPALSKDLVPVNELRANLAAVLKRVERTGQPVVVTQRGKAAAVLIHPHELDELDEQKELVHKVLRGLSESESGNLIDEDDVWNEIDEIVEAAEAAHEGQMDSRSAG